MPYFLQVHTWNLMVEQDTYRWEDSFCRPTGGSPWYRPRFQPAGPKISRARLSFCNPWLFGMNIGMVFRCQNCSSDQEKHLKFEAEGREFAKFLKSLGQFAQTVKGQNNI